MVAKKPSNLADDPLWYKDAVIYEVHVRAFCDSNDDGIGDFRGLTSKLDYLQDLGVSAIWLLPFYPSPLKDDGYDISDYFSVHPAYGTLRDFREFLNKAHERGMRVITELILNHTSDQHPWFQRSRHARRESKWRDFYVWSDTPEKYRDARIIFKDFESSNWAWDSTAKAYYWHRFYSHQPDLNFDNPAVCSAVARILDFWLKIGVDGLRLDAVPYLFERENTNCENLPETYDFLRSLRTQMDGKFSGRITIAEANQWPEDAAAYFGGGDMCHMAFHFPLMPRMFISIQMENRFPITDILDQTPSIPDTCQWALFLRNHDELTLEMVTDEERDYMYGVYAKDPRARINLGIRRRLSPLMGNNRRSIELMNALLFSLPGTPVIYYGDEIGMGDNYYLGDRNGVRTPMQWSPDRNGGFSGANPQSLYLPIIIDPEYHFESINVENQQRNPSSLLWWMKRMVAIRKRLKPLSRGNIEFLPVDNQKVLVFVRTYQDESVLVAANLSRYFQVAEIPLEPWRGRVPVEVASQNRFPPIREVPYNLILGPNQYVWLLLKKESEFAANVSPSDLPSLKVRGDWKEVLEGEAKRRLEEEILPAYVSGCRWFGGKTKRMASLTIVEAIPLHDDTGSAFILILRVRYGEGGNDFLHLPLSFAITKALADSSDEMLVEGVRVRIDEEWLTIKASMIAEQHPQSIIARVESDRMHGMLYDAVYDNWFRSKILSFMIRRQRLKGAEGEAAFLPGSTTRSLLADSDFAGPLLSKVMKAEQSNSSIRYGDKLFFKFFRTLKEGINPDREIVQFLTEKTRFSNVPPFAGCVEYRRQASPPVVLGLMQRFVVSQGDGWSHTLDTLGRYYEQALSTATISRETPNLPSSIFDVHPDSEGDPLRGLIEGHYLGMVALLGRRTAELHQALASNVAEPDFAPEPFSLNYQRSIYQSMQALTRQVFRALGKALPGLPAGVESRARKVLSLENDIITQFRAILERRISATKIRIHGDFHLGQVLFTGKDFFIIDFEGEPARSLSERRLKKSPLQDVAGMIRSFHYAAHFALKKEHGEAADGQTMIFWADLWYRYVAALFLTSYLNAAGRASFLPQERAELITLLKAYLLDKSVYEIGYELNNRPEWVGIPLLGIESLLERPTAPVGVKEGRRPEPPAGQKE